MNVQSPIPLIAIMRGIARGLTDVRRTPDATRERAKFFVTAYKKNSA